VVQEGPAGLDPLFHRLKLARGVTILEGPPGVYRAVRFPTQDEQAASAPALYMGGHEYVVDDATKTALIAAGVGVDASNFTTPPGGYGFDGYGNGAYGG
jgi:hypothetical protein